MDESTGKKLGKVFGLVQGNAPKQPTAQRMADIRLERTMRECGAAMQTKDGKSISKNFRNVANGTVKMTRAFQRRVKEAKAARNAAHNYPILRRAALAFVDYVDDSHTDFRMASQRPTDRDNAA